MNAVFNTRRLPQDLALIAEIAECDLRTTPRGKLESPSIRCAPRTDMSSWSIDAVIDKRAVETLFQPVVYLATGNVVGFEALSRGPAGSALESPMALLTAAEHVGRLGELDWLCRTNAMKAATEANLHPSVSWLINVEPAGLAIECPEYLLPTVAKARSDLRIILEVVERDVKGYVIELLLATDQARRDSWGVALDDVGAEEGSLALLPVLRPDVVKLDMSLVQAVPKGEAAAITAAVRAYAESTGAVILAEGIETEEHEKLARVSAPPTDKDTDTANRAHVPYSYRHPSTSSPCASG
jgi:EAL domain-containing protein (putative c-di-GMP-specific phosphodiesterase class I)